MTDLGTMFLIIILICLLFIFGLVALRYTSPTIFIFPACVLTSLNAILLDKSNLSIIILLFWLVIFIALTIFCARKNIRLVDLRIVFSGKFNSRTARRWSFALSVMLFSGTVMFWIMQSGVSEFTSQKRIYSSGEFYNFANLLTGAFIMFPIFIFGLKPLQQRIYTSHKILAFIILIWSFIQGYVSSDRGLFFYAILFIIILRVCQQRYMSSKLQTVALGVLVLLIQIPILAQISAERTSRDVDGYEILYEQAFKSDGGYGFSVAKDRTVYKFVERTGPVMDPVFMLGGFYGLVPRAWWQEKPKYVGTGPIAGSLVFREDPVVTRGAGIPISMPSELALLLGLSGFWIGMILYFFLAIFSYLAIRRYPLYFIPFILFAAQLPGGGLPKSMNVFVLNLIGVVFISRLLNFRVVHVGKRFDRPYRGKALSVSNHTELPS